MCWPCSGCSQPFADPCSVRYNPGNQLPGPLRRPGAKPQVSGGFCVFQPTRRAPSPRKTNVYVDAFNLYYGSLKGTPHKWLNLRTLCETVFPQNDIQRIRVFLARVQARPHDPDQPLRQQTYIRALLTVHEGRFLTTRKRLPLVAPPARGPKSAEVWTTEEKGSDVNLATYLLCDGYEKDYEGAIVISNDSDLAFPVQVALQKFGVPVLVLNPYRYPNPQLKSAATFVRQLRPGVLAASQFPPQHQDVAGVITKPASW